MRRLLSILILTGGLMFVSMGRVTEETPPSPAPSPEAAVSQIPTLGTVKPSSSGTTVRPRQPEHLHLWRFDAPVVALLLTGSELVPPDDPQVLGWWGRPACARQGTTLLTGHTVSTGGGEFDDLEMIPVGTRGSLSGCKYEVASVEVISKTELAERAPRLFSQTGKHRLVLVTCEGYDPSTGHYDSNVVVILRPV